MSYRAVRQLELMLPGLAYQRHLMETDPERYREHMRSLVRREPCREPTGIVIAEIIYPLDSEGHICGEPTIIRDREQKEKLVTVLEQLLEKRQALEERVE